MRGDLRQGEIAACMQELFRPFDAARDDILVRRQPGGRLELPREVVGAQAGDRGDLLQGRAGVEVFLDVLDDGAEPPPRQRAVAPRSAGGAPRRVGSGERPGRWPETRRRAGPRRRRRSARRPPRPSRPGAAGDPGRRAAGSSAAPGRGRTPRRRPARPGPAPGRCGASQSARSTATVPGCRPAPPRSIRGGRYVPLHSFIQQVQFFRRPGKKDEPVVGKGGRVEFRGGRRAVASRLQAHPPQPVARRGRLERDELAQDCQGPERASVFRLLMSHRLRLPHESGQWHGLSLLWQ